MPRVNRGRAIRKSRRKGISLSRQGRIDSQLKKACGRRGLSIAPCDSCETEDNSEERAQPPFHHGVIILLYLRISATRQRLVIDRCDVYFAQGHAVKMYIPEEGGWLGVGFPDKKCGAAISDYDRSGGLAPSESLGLPSSHSSPDQSLDRVNVQSVTPADEALCACFADRECVCRLKSAIMQQMSASRRRSSSVRRSRRPPS